MQPAQKNSKPFSLHPKKNRWPDFMIALLIFGAFKGWPLLFAQAEQIAAPVTPPLTAPAQGLIPAVAKDEKPVSFEEKHKNWAVIMLLYETRVKVREDWSHETHIHRKVLIQTKDGKAMGEIPVYYDADTEEIRVVKIVTITRDGREHPPAKIQDLSVHEEFGMYSNERKKVFSMPEVTPGVMIEVEYIKTTKRQGIPDSFWNIQYAEEPFPIKEHRITFLFPKSLGIRHKSFLNGKWDPEIRDEGRSTVYSWERKDYGPDTDPEERFPPPPTAETIGDGIEFSSIKSWQDVAAWYGGLIRKNQKITPEIAGAAQTATKGKRSVRDKTRAVLEYLQDHLRYVSMSFGEYSMAPHPTDEVFRNKYGDCKDQSLLAKAMLGTVGVEADLCLFLNESHGSDPKDDLPVPGLYDHVLLKVYDPKEGDFYADPLLEGYDIGEYPMGYQHAYTFVIGAKGGEFGRFPVFDRKRVEEFSSETIEIRSDGSARNTGEKIWSLEDSIDLRNRVRSMNDAEEKKFFDNMHDYLAGGGRTIKIKFKGLEKRYGRVRSEAVTDRPDDYPVNDGLMVIDLQQIGSDDWIAKERKAPIFSPANMAEHETRVYIVPEDFEVTHLPKGFDLDNGFFRFERQIERTGNKIEVRDVRSARRIELPASEYPRIKAFYDKLPSLTEQRIILKKKEA